MGSVNKTTNLGLPQWLGNEYFERTDMNDAFKSIDDAMQTVDYLAKKYGYTVVNSNTEEGKSPNIKLTVGDDSPVTATRKTLILDDGGTYRITCTVNGVATTMECYPSISGISSSGAGALLPFEVFMYLHNKNAADIASAKTELQNNIDTLGTKVNALWCAMLEAGYAYSCTMEEDYSASVAGVMGTGTNSGNVADLYCCETLGTAVQLGKKETYVFSADSDSSGVGYDTVIEVYTIGGTKRRYKQVADANGNWSGTWS